MEELFEWVPGSWTRAPLLLVVLINQRLYHGLLHGMLVKTEANEAK